MKTSMYINTFVTILRTDDHTEDLDDIDSGIILNTLRPKELRFSETVEGRHHWELIWVSADGSEHKEELIENEPFSVRMGNSREGRWIKCGFGLSTDGSPG